MREPYWSNRDSRLGQNLDLASWQGPAPDAHLLGDWNDLSVLAAEHPVQDIVVVESRQRAVRQRWHW